MKNKISEITRKKIADTIELSDVSIEGDLGYHEFLNRIFDLKSLPSYDHRYDNAYSDINCHTRWGDYETKTWMFNDARFNLIRCSDDVFIKVIEESLHPLVCRADDRRQKLKGIYDKLLPNDNFELYVSEIMSSIEIYSVREIAKGPDIAGKKHAIISYFNSEYVSSKIKIMEENLNDNPDLSLGTAKELIETYCKSVLKGKDIEYDKDWELQKLFKRTIDVVDFVDLTNVDNPQQAEKSVKQLLSGCNSIIHGVTELRNAYGTGHGKDKDFVCLPSSYVRFVIATVADIILFLLQINGETTEISE